MLRWGAVVVAMADGASGLGLALAAAGIWGFALRLHSQLVRFDAEFPELCLVLFRDALHHVCRIHRVLRQPRGNMLVQKGSR